jgi:proteic killer suppression protein
MLKSFRRKGLEKFFKSGSKAGIQADHVSRLRIQLTALMHATGPVDMNTPRWRLHRLSWTALGLMRFQ